MLTKETDTKELTSRQKRRLRRLESIREAALALVIDDGVDNFSVHRLAESLDLTVGALYRYYAGVDEILMAVQVAVLEDFDRYFASVVQTSKDEALERIALLFRAYIELDHLQPERFRLIGRFVSNPDPVFNDEAARAGMEPTLRLLGHLADVIQEAQEDGVLDGGAPMDLAIVGWSSIQGIIERRKLGRLEPEMFDAERLTRLMLRTLLVGWGADVEIARQSIDNLPKPEYFEAALTRATTH